MIHKFKEANEMFHAMLVKLKQAGKGLDRGALSVDCSFEGFLILHSDSISQPGRLRSRADW